MSTPAPRPSPAGGAGDTIPVAVVGVGHMGAVTGADILATIGAIEGGLKRSGYRFEVGAGLAAAQAALEGLSQM